MDTLVGSGAAVVDTVRKSTGGSVVVWSADPEAYSSDHERATRSNFAQRLAALKQFRFAGEYDASRARENTPLYFVPSDTVSSTQLARSLGISTLHDLFGGVVPYPFVATKAITHPLAGRAAACPEGWTPAFATGVSDAVLDGFSAFSLEDARWAGRQLLDNGPVRVKPVCATGGRGQTVVTDAEALDRCLAAMEESEIALHGVVVEENLENPETYSVGQVLVDHLIMSYYGRQRMTRGNDGQSVYGGSDLTLVRGNFDALLAMTSPPPALCLAIEQARRYHHAVIECFPGFFASRVNYDVAQGVGTGGTWRSGVLEQSWRVGGATGAEMVALECFWGDPTLDRVRVSCFEAYGAQAPIPDDAKVHYRGIDKQTGHLTKYALQKPYDSDPT
ncbi:DUF3182 family protein [Variovorax sp. V213]|uniref:DUF3182 family protein n=1 Tax=Variovorax sp. V213 TaxID=3065955 RepID=UPI0034E8E3B0